MDMSPMTDEELLKALGRLGVDRDSLRALPLLPLVQVAWADGRVQQAERGLIHEVATKYGLSPEGMGLLKRWLDVRPSEKSFLLARRVLLALWARDREHGEAPENLDGVIRMCMCVARVAGGLFGLAFTLDRREVELIGEISQSLQLGPALSPAGKQAIRPSSPAARALSRAPTKPIVHRAATPPRARPSGTPEPDPADLLHVPPTPSPAPPSEPGPEPDAVVTARHPTLTPVTRLDDAGTVPLASLRRLREIGADEETELDLPILPQAYDAASHADWVDDWVDEPGALSDATTDRS